MAGYEVSDSKIIFPFSALVGMKDVLLALMLNAVDPKIGGVLLRGEKGTAKSTAARGLSQLLGREVPFIEIPIGASEDRVIGSLDIKSAIEDGREKYRPGLLAQANGGIVYVDEINLLAPHLTDILLDSSASGYHRVERDGISIVVKSEYILIGSMNPEEGSLRPQLLDRFGLCVDVESEYDVDNRVLSLKRRLEFDDDPSSVYLKFKPSENELLRKIRYTNNPKTNDELLRKCSSMALEHRAQGLRADLTLYRASVAHAKLMGKESVSDDDLEVVAPFVLKHRSKISMQDENVSSRKTPNPAKANPPKLDSQFDQGNRNSRNYGYTDSSQSKNVGYSPDKSEKAGNSKEKQFPEVLSERSVSVQTSVSKKSNRGFGKTGLGADSTGPLRQIRSKPFEDGEKVDFSSTMVEAAKRRLLIKSDEPFVTQSDLRSSVNEIATERVIIFSIDISGSMGADERLYEVSRTLDGLLNDSYLKRFKVAIVTFGGSGANILTRPTRSIDIAKECLKSVKVGGITPLHEGLKLSRELAEQEILKGNQVVLIIVTDGRATVENGINLALLEAEKIDTLDLDPIVVYPQSNDGDVLGVFDSLVTTLGGRRKILGDDIL